MLEHRFEGLGLLVTAGFRHIIEIARQSVPDGYGNSFFWVKPPRLVPLHLVQEVTERMRHDGSVMTPLDEESVIEAVDHSGRFRRQAYRRLSAPFLRQPGA